MIPQLVTVGYRRPNGRRRRLYLPVVPAVLLLSPLLLLALLGGVIACLFFQMSPAKTLRGAGRLIWAMPGTRIELYDGQTDLVIIIR
jgi:hypothetical protein